MPSTPGKPKVLIVDDEPSILSSIADLLESEFEVYIATDPRRALEALVTREISVIISDQRMPDMSGDEFLRIAKQRSAATRVLLTGYADIEALARVINDGKIYAYISKPWDPLELRTTVRNAATEYRLLNSLRYERELLHTLVSNLPDCIYIQDSSQRYTMVNNAFAELAGLANPEEAVGKTESECLPGHFGASAASDGRSILESGQAIIDKHDEWHASGGTVRWYSSTRVPVRGSVDDAIESLVGISRDITANKQIETHLRQAKETALETVRAKQEFLARTSHEIRTPLNSILGMGELLAATGLSGQQQRYLEVFRTNGQTLLRLLNDLLDLSRSDLSSLRLESSEFDLCETVAETIETLAAEAASRGLNLSFDCSDQVPRRLLGDAGRLRQILTNLIGNGLKFTQRGGIQLTIDGRSSENCAVLLQFSVKDTGIGIAADKLQDIFEPFNQVEKFATSPYGGTGLGLAICRQLVRQMDGTIWVESSPGIGSVFHFTARFEVPEIPNPAFTPQRQTQAHNGSLSGPHVLLAEDNTDNVFLIQAYLGADKIEVASNGREAFDKFMLGKFDIVLMDLQMPEMDGLEATRLIREWERCQGLNATPILACTAHSSAEEISLKAGCTGHLIKPISKDSLLAAMADCFAVSQ